MSGSFTLGWLMTLEEKVFNRKPKEALEEIYELKV